MEKQVYLTLPRKQVEYQLTFQQLLSDDAENILERMNRSLKDTYDTQTYHILESRIKENLIKEFDTNGVIKKMQDFISKYEHLFSEDRKNLYRRFWIPKKSKPNATRHCDMRQIDAPNDELKKALRELKDEIFEQGCLVKYHSSCFSYIKGRRSVDAVARHQNNQSRWFLKLDLKNFFPSTTEEFIYQQLSVIFPFTEIVKREDGVEALKKCINLCTLNGGLPQGTPISPLLTNIVMIPIDYTISKYLHSLNGKYCYTRYADDILISSPYKFDSMDIQNAVVKIFKSFNCPFWLNKEKTRFGSSAGRNWNLGVMLNGDNQITIGHERKRYLKAQLNNFILDYLNGSPWSLKQTQKFYGNIAYYRSIEPAYVDEKIKFFSEKYNCNVTAAIKSILKGETIFDFS